MEGLTGERVDESSVVCSSNHLTSFSVLVGVGGVHEEVGLYYKNDCMYIVVHSVTVALDAKCVFVPVL